MVNRFALAALLLVVSLAPAFAQGRGGRGGQSGAPATQPPATKPRDEPARGLWSTCGTTAAASTLTLRRSFADARLRRRGTA